jgi:hypothetical protein
MLTVCLIIAHGITSAQDQIQSGATELTAAQPLDTTKTPEIQGLGESFTASDAANEYYVNLNWTIYQQCLFGSHMSIKLYRDNVLIYSYTYPAVTFGLGYTHGYTDVVGPGKSHTYKLDRFCSDGFLCNVHWAPTNAGSTQQLRPPTNVSVTNSNNSDKFINMSWQNGSALTTYYKIYEGNTQIATTSSTSYTVSTTPGKTANWSVATYTSSFNGRTSTKVGATVSTAAFHKPLNFFASEDTTVGYIRLGWTCATQYGTQFKIYRDDLDFATIPVSQKSFLDYNTIPGQRYKYVVKSYNPNSSIFSAPSTEEFGRAVQFSASDGNYDGEVYLFWTDFPADYENELRIYRDGARLDGVFSNQVDKYDRDINPGKIHEYKLEVLNNNELRLTVYDHGFAPADGYVKGSVTTPTGSGGVKNVEMRAYATDENLSSALALDGIDDYVSVPALYLNSNTLTMSAWIKRNGVQNDWSGVIFSRDRNTTAGLYVQSNGELRYNWDDQSSTYDWASGLIVPNNQWTFVALVIEAERAILYVDDSSAVNTVAHAIEEFDGKLEIGRDNSSATRYFKGSVDEVCVWQTARLEEEIVATKQHILSGTETDLVACWRFNLGSGAVAGDYAERGDNHGTIFGEPVWISDSPHVWHYGLTKTNGSYTIPRINWEEDVDFTIKPFKEGHGFRGSNFPEDSLILPFSEDDHQYQDINFIDTTSIGISGWVYFNSDSSCPVPGVKILINNESTGEYTDSTGHYSISVASAGNYTLSTEYLNHTIIPADTLLNLQDPVTDLIFWDTTMTTLSGKVAGGCNNFLGVADIHIRSLVTQCFDTVLTTDENGLYEITLPAQRYFAQLVEIDHPDRLTIINYFTPDTVDISLQDTIHNFIYHSPPIITISELPANGCGLYAVPILVQERTYAMRIDVTEKYGALECQVASGTVTIYDGVAYDNPESTHELEDGGLYYPLIPGYPNLTANPAHPHQKSLVVEANIDKYTIYDTLWVFVRGQKPHEFQFSTVSPEIPLMVLHDPPGDQSYSFLSQTTTSSINIGFSFESEVGVGIFTKFKVGGGGDIPGVGSTGAWLGGEAEANVGIRQTLEGNQEIVISATEMLKTSDSDAIVGAQGDVFMGAALNILYAKTDILEYDADNCTVVRDTGIVWNGDGFKTTYLYTESHIRESVIPGLQTLADILNSSGVQIKQDSAEVLLNQRDVWQQVLDYNDSLKFTAKPLTQFPSNVSFSAGTNLSEESSITSTSILSIGLNLFIDASLAVSVGAKVGDFNEAESGVKIFSKLDIGISGGVSYEISNTIGFELGDDDDDPPGDVFTVDIKGDPVYGTPVFDLLGGTSSCPWEDGTLPREGVELAINTPILTNIPPEQPASFDLYLTNTSQNDESRTYLLSLVQGSNPDGAIISVGGAVLGDDELSFTMPPNRDDPQRATLRVAREVGSVYDYDNLQVHLYSQCDADIDTTLSFSVHFLKPCSDVNILRPARSWVVNSSHNETMEIVLKDYDTTNELMSELKFEYRLHGTDDWTELFSYPRATLPADSISYSWDMSSMQEGIYELRASTHCTLGTYYTRTHAGIFDYTAPVTFGQPQPSDGSLEAGEDIRIEFSEDINCLTANTTNIKMHNIDKDSDVPINIDCKGDELLITAVNQEDLVEGDSIRVTIQSLSDPFGNVITEPISWAFVVNIVSLLPENVAPKIPTEFSLSQNYPNPFNPETTIRFGIPNGTEVEMVIYNIKGQLVMRPVAEHLAAGFYNVIIDGSHLSTGVYFYRLRAGNFVETKKLILLK